MKIMMHQYGGPDHEFGSVAEYEDFLRTTSEDLVHLQEVVEAEDQSTREATEAQITAMWDRLLAEA